MRNLAVFCSSSNTIPEEIKKEALNLAKELTKHDVSLIYGGGKVGLMGIIGNEFKNKHKHKTGIIPNILKSVEVAATDDDKQIVTDTMQERKHLLISKADTFIILPGGIGTLDEFFEVLTMKQIGLIKNDKKIILANWFGFYNELIKQLQKMSEQGFTKFEKDWFVICNNNKEIIKHIFG